MTDTLDGAWRYVREELAALRGDVTGLRAEVRTLSEKQGPEIAVLQHRADAHDREIQALKDARRHDRTDQQWSTSIKVSAALALLAVLASVVIGLLNLTQGA